jgi:hypothetical protein
MAPCANRIALRDVAAGFAKEPSCRHRRRKPPVPFLEAVRRALEGDPVMVREVLGAVGASSVPRPLAGI